MRAKVSEILGAARSIRDELRRDVAKIERGLQDPRFEPERRQKIAEARARAKSDLEPLLRAARELAGSEAMSDLQQRADLRRAIERSTFAGKALPVLEPIPGSNLQREAPDATQRRLFNAINAMGAQMTEMNLRARLQTASESTLARMAQEAAKAGDCATFRVVGEVVDGRDSASLRASINMALAEFKSPDDVASAADELRDVEGALKALGAADEEVRHGREDRSEKDRLIAEQGAEAFIAKLHEDRRARKAGDEKQLEREAEAVKAEVIAEKIEAGADLVSA